MLSPKPWRPDAIALLFLSVLVCICFGSIASAGSLHFSGAKTMGTLQMLIATLSFQGAALILIARFLREHHVNWSEAFGFARNWRYAVAAGFVAGCLFVPAGWALEEVSARAMTRLHQFIPLPQEQQAVQALRHTVSWAPRVVLGAVTILLVPAAEEMLFRGILFPAICQAGFPRLAWWGTSVLFAAMHMNLMIFLPLLALAMLLAYLYERTDNLLAPIAAHSLFNAVNFVTLFLQNQGG
jgi:membrane protease YdiL (CAAX protease family)